MGMLSHLGSSSNATVRSKANTCGIWHPIRLALRFAEREMGVLTHIRDSWSIMAMEEVNISGIVRQCDVGAIKQSSPHLANP